MGRSTVVRAAVFLATVFAAWSVLSLGTVAETQPLTAGAVATQAYVADRTDTIEDVDATEEARESARAGVERPFHTDPNVEQAVYESVARVFAGIRSIDLTDRTSVEQFTTPSLDPTETTTTEAETEEESDPAVVMGRVFLDADGDGEFDPETEFGRSDMGIPNISVAITTGSDDFEVETNGEGIWTVEFEGGALVFEVDTQDPDIPEGFLIGPVNPGQQIECAPGETCEAESVAFHASLRPVEEVAERIGDDHALPEATASYLAEVAREDLVRAAFSEPQLLPVIEAAARERVTTEFGRRITPDQLLDAQRTVRSNPPTVQFNSEIDPEAGVAAAELVAGRLQANYQLNTEEYQRLQDEAAGQVEPVIREVVAGETIVNAGERLRSWHIAAIDATRTPTLDEQPGIGLLAVITVLIALIGVYLSVFRPEFWSRPRMLALLGILLVLAAGAVRATVALDVAFVAMPGQVGWYVLPAVAFGFITAVLFDQRIAILMALAVGVLAAVGTLDTGVTVYAMLAALAPIPFVSKVSTRGAFRNAVVKSSLVAAGVAAATSWFFHVGPNETVIEVVPIAVAWAFGVSVLASLLGLAALQFFESAFDITTTLSLLDLTDRNHEALQMLQEKAFGTFNHSLMVGTLAHAAARAIGADPLLARAMAYYHDLGKTENPMFFIENQFGVSNPHDDLDPKESARIIRDHVSVGLALAHDYRIPTEVSEGIVSHHGDGVMRYFYEKARQTDGDQVDIDDFRHIGHKPKTQETAILMLADSLEAACRAEFQAQGQETSPDAIEKVVNRVIDEKMEDGQLSEAPLTLGELTKVRLALLDSLIGHYHQRIPYPNFPGK